MRRKIAIIKSTTVVPLLVILAVLLVLIAIFQPWWSMNTSPELQMMTNTMITANVGLFRTVNVARTDTNATNTLTFDITNTTAYQDPIFQAVTAKRTDGNFTTTFTFGISNTTTSEVAKDVADQTNQTFILVITGLVLAIAMMILILMITMRNMPLEKYTYAIGVLATVVLLIAPVLLALNVPYFFGSTTLTYISSTWNGRTLATWGPSTGWYLSIAAALIIIVCLLPVRTMYSDRRRGMQSLK
jgi:ABC-type dipeptide/oligopeptide/nickel transport system permease component